MRRTNIIHERPLFCWLFIVLLGLSGCRAAPAAPPTATRAPVFTPTAGADLPQIPDSLYVLERGQVARISADGRSRTVLTEEPEAIEGYPAISAFDLLPDGGLVYVAITKAGTRLMRQVEGQAAQLIFEQERILLSELIADPSGGAVTLYLRDSADAQRYRSGIYRLSLADGSLTLLLADPQQREGIMLPTQTVRAVSYRPDGEFLLIHQRDEAVQECRQALLRRDGTLIEPQAAAGTTLFCGEERWAPDGSLLLVAGRADGPGIQRLGVDGQLTLLTPEGVAGRAPLERSDGSIVFFAVQQVGENWQFRSAELSADGSVTYRGEELGAIPSFAVWTGDGSGVALVVNTDSGSELRYLRQRDGVWRVIPQTPDGVAQISWANGAR